MEWVEPIFGFINTAIVPIALVFGRIWYTSLKDAAEVKRVQNGIMADMVATMEGMRHEVKALRELHNDADSKFSTVGMMGKLIAIETKLGTM